VLEGMMSQLMSKEMLYEPMKDLVEKVIAQWTMLCITQYSTLSLSL
jgi:hypothetical protein